MGRASSGARCLAAVQALLACACAAAPAPQPAELDAPFRAELPVSVARSVEDAIEHSLPEVSYRWQDPFARGSGAEGSSGRRDVESLLRIVESLSGEDRIVCRVNGESAFGSCVFPQPANATPER